MDGSPWPHLDWKRLVDLELAVRRAQERSWMTA
jgi:hypothetical protein